LPNSWCRLGIAGWQLSDNVLQHAAVVFPMSRGAVDLLPWQVSEAAVADAHRNAERNGIANARFVRLDLDKSVPSIGGQGGPPNVNVIVTGNAQGSRRSHKRVCNRELSVGSFMLVRNKRVRAMRVCVCGSFALGRSRGCCLLLLLLSVLEGLVLAGGPTEVM
jgi:hypothetical protein